MKIGVLVFPGSNCDHDCEHVFKDVLGQHVEMIWHKETWLSGLDAIVIPGGFSYGDYLRTGAIARFSPVMGAVKEFAKNGGLGHRHLQRVSDSARSRIASRGDAAEPLAPFRLQGCSCAGGKCRHPFHWCMPARPGAQNSDRPCRRELLHRSRDAGWTAGQCSEWSFAIAHRRAR